MKGTYPLMFKCSITSDLGFHDCQLLACFLHESVLYICLTVDYLNYKCFVDDRSNLPVYLSLYSVGIYDP